MSEEREIDKICLPMNPCKPLEIPTDEELMALNKMRDIRNCVRQLKEKQSQLRAQKEEEAEKLLKDIESGIDSLKTEWKEWEKKKDEADRERMIMLGHEDP